ncbi:MAG: aminoglycoside phosphotransferase family protein, partial [Lentisphaerae bacterium]|nr:aminoglycoside phosphotransferase family protein [Lentisphaerota bacterium]
GAVGAEIAFARARADAAGRLQDLLESGTLPERVTHNDTKLNNVLIDDETGRGICVIDLDTVMPGLSLYDFGDMVRSVCNSADEDEPDVEKVRFRMPFFEALVQGYLETAGGFLTQGERGELAFAGRLITLEIGVRFLTDHLNGDTYFRTHRPEQNLDRCRVQFRLVRLMETREAEMRAAVRACAG